MQWVVQLLLKAGVQVILRVLRLKLLLVAYYFELEVVGLFFQVLGKLAYYFLCVYGDEDLLAHLKVER